MLFSLIEAKNLYKAITDVLKMGSDDILLLFYLNNNVKDAKKLSFTHCSVTGQNNEKI